MNPGETLDGRYEITARLGAGGMGEVYKATHTLLGAPRVIKVVHANIAANADARDRFLREARVATKIQHQNVATLHDFATLVDGSHYMVWEFIDGENLAQRLRASGTLPPREAVRIAIEALHGLDAIHRAGIIHRDISPENLMITRDGAVKIIDLGVAKADDAEGVAQTRTGIFVGKLRYASPEQLGFLPEGEKIDGRTDLYAVAMVLIELLTGRPPYEAKSPHEYFLHHAREVPQTTIELPASFEGSRALEQILAKALSRDRNQRFANAREFAAALEKIEQGLPETSATAAALPAPDAATVITGDGGTRTVQTGATTAATGKLSLTTPSAASPTVAETLRTPLPDPSAPAMAPQAFAAAAPQPRKNRAVLVLAAALLLLVVGGAGGAYVMWPALSSFILKKPSAAPVKQAAVAATPAVRPESTLTVTPAEETPVLTETTATQAPPPVVQTPPAPAVKAEPAERAPIPARGETSAEDEAPARARRPAVYRDGPGFRAGNELAVERLRRELRGVTKVTLLAGANQVEVYRAIHRVVPDLEFTDDANVVIRFDTGRTRLGRERAHLSAGATIEKDGHPIFLYELSSWVDPAAAADAFAQTIADAF